MAKEVFEVSLSHLYYSKLLLYKHAFLEVINSAENCKKIPRLEAKIALKWVLTEKREVLRLLGKINYDETGRQITQLVVAIKVCMNT